MTCRLPKFFQLLCLLRRLHEELMSVRLGRHMTACQIPRYYARQRCFSIAAAFAIRLINNYRFRHACRLLMLLHASGRRYTVLRGF